MADPFTLGFIAANCAWGAVKGLSGRASVAAAKQVAEALTKNRTPSGRDVLEATHRALVRSIRLMAQACSVTGGQAKDQFSARALSKIAWDQRFSTLPPDGDRLSAKELKNDLDLIIEITEADAESAVTALIARLENTMGEPLSEVHQELFRNGSDKHRSWPQAFELFFAEEVMKNEGIFRLLAVGRIDEVISFAQAHRADISSAHQTMGEFREEVRERFEALQVQLDDILARVSKRDDGAPVVLLRSLAQAFGESRPAGDAAELESYLRGKISEYHQLRARIQAVEHEDNHDSALLADADLAIKNGDFDRADRLLMEAEEGLDARIGRLLLRKSQRRALRGDALKLRGDFKGAIQHYDEAAAMLPQSEHEARFALMKSAAQAAFDWGDQFGNASGLSEAIRRWRSLAAASKIGSFQWASFQFSLGNAYHASGELEEDTASLDTAIHCYHEALKVYTRRRSPENWAMTQDNLALVLFALGERDRTRATLDDVLAGHRAALKVHTRKEHPGKWAISQNNIARALMEAGERDGDRKHFEKAELLFRYVANVWTPDKYPLEWAYSQINISACLFRLSLWDTNPDRLYVALDLIRDAFKVITKEKYPVRWIDAQINRGSMLVAISDYEDELTSLEQGIDVYFSVLEVSTRARFPLTWAQTQDALGQGLAELGQRKGDSGPLKEAIEAHRSALEVYAKDKLPLQWADTQSNLGCAMGTLAEQIGDAATARSAISALRQGYEMVASCGYPAQQASVLGHLSSALRYCGELEQETDALEEAVATARAAVDSCLPRQPAARALALEYHAEALMALAAHNRDRTMAHEAVEKFRESLAQASSSWSVRRSTRLEKSLAKAAGLRDELSGEL